MQKHTCKYLQHTARDGYLYFTTNQLHRQASYHWGHDLREKPYSIMRVKIENGPVLLR